MGFHLRKSFKCGPLRFNLSNSGIGVSAGVKGLRVGIDGKGRSYVGGGVGMLRYREYLGKGKTSNSTTCSTISNNDNPECIQYYEIPEELTPNYFIFFLMALATPFVLFGIMLTGYSLISEGIAMSIFFLIVTSIISLPFLGLKRFIRGINTSRAVHAFNYGNYSFAYKQFAKTKKLSKSLRYSVRMFLDENIYKCLCMLNETDKLIDFLRTDCELANKYEYLLQIYFQLNEYGKVIDLFETEECIFEVSKDKNSFCPLVYESYIKLGKYNEALAFLDKYKYDVRNVEDKIIYCYEKLEKYSEIINYIQKNISASTKDEYPHYYAVLSKAFMQLGQPEIALETLLSGPIRKRNMDNEMCAFRYALGECYEANGDIKNALKQYQKIYSFDINYEDVAQKIELLSRKEVE